MATEFVAPALSGRFSGHEAFAGLVRHAFERAAADGWPEIILSDPSFEGWPLGETSTVHALQAWAKPGRRLVLLAGRFDLIIRQQPRFVAWRKAWSHLVDGRLCPASALHDLPSAIWSRHWFLLRTDSEAGTGQYGAERVRLRGLHEALQHKLNVSVTGFAATTLGL
jgi:hypothetical protein